MTEQEILDNISTLRRGPGVDARIYQVNKMQDYLHQLKSGKRKASASWINSSSITFPEDFEEEMNHLSSSLAPIDSMLAQLDRIERALKDRKKLLEEGPSI